MGPTSIFDFQSGESPLLVSLPHVGTTLPSELSERMTEPAKKLPDTDWDTHLVYDFLVDMDVSVLRANYSRYLVDLNRSAENESLYPGQSETGVCTTTLFDSQPIYNGGCEPGESEIANRIELYWKPYHQKIQQELERIHQRFGYALLLDAHSIKSRVPRFFAGQLPDFNWGTGDGKSCDPSLSKVLLDKTLENSVYSAVLNGRFKGGYITRSYGQPEKNIHAIQLELSQATYMANQETFELDPEKMAAVKLQLQKLIKILLSYGDKQ